MSDLFGNHIVGFPTRRLISTLQVESLAKKTGELKINPSKDKKLSRKKKKLHTEKMLMGEVRIYYKE